MSEMLSDFDLLHGRDEPVAEPLGVRAGSVTAAIDGLALRWVHHDGTEVVRGVYPAIRDETWGTLDAHVLAYEREAADERFLVRYEARSRKEQVDFAWVGRIEGTPDGTIECSFHGLAGSAFSYGRIGLNLLYPLSFAGRPFRGLGPGGKVAGQLPTEIAPQLCADGVYVGLFPPVTSLVVEMADGVEVCAVFEGDLFEMEDQRNWTDASFKTYSTPLALGLTHDAKPGQAFSQVVRISVRAARAARTGGSRNRRTCLELGEPLEHGLPALGLGLPDELTPPTGRERRLLRALALDHVRADVHPRARGAEQRLAAASDYARSLDTSLELALHLPRDVDVPLAFLAGAPLGRVLVFSDDRVTTPGRLVIGVREQLRGLGIECPVGGGTDTLFADLNGERPDARSMDVVGYPLNAQMHAFDDASVMETAPIHGLTVQTARSWCEGRPIAVTPITLRMRCSPRVERPLPAPADEVPADVDHRQPSLLCASWTVASLASLAYAGAAAVTYFETVGWRGVLDSEQGTQPADRFRSQPGMVFPVYHALAAVAESRSGVLVDVASPAEASVGALAVRTDGALRVFVANLAPQRQEVDVAKLPPGRVSVRLLDVAAARALMKGPAPLTETHATSEMVCLALPAYGVAVVDVASEWYRSTS